MTTDVPPNEVSILARTGAASIAYRYQGGTAPGVVFLPGFRSDMTGTKASALAQWCRTRGQACLRFDYGGHGLSAGDFGQGTIGGWADDALAVFDSATQGPQILVGSSMGGWIMLLLALRRPERVAGLVGIAAAPDFTEDLIWPALTIAQRARLAADGAVRIPSVDGEEPYPITSALIEDARRHLLLRGPLRLVCPVRLLHGLADADVPWRTAIKLAESLAGTEVVVTFVKDGDHRLSRPRDLERMFAAVAELTLLFQPPAASRAASPIR